jgi:hypothetical protein
MIGAAHIDGRNNIKIGELRFTFNIMNADAERMSQKRKTE